MREKGKQCYQVSSSGSNAGQLREVPQPLSVDNSQDNGAALLLARIRQLENEKAEQEEKNAVRILKLEEEIARLKCSHAGQKGEGDIDASMNKSIPFADELLLESLSYLKRWDLDGMPMVGHQFLRVTAPFEDAETSRLKQRRMIDCYVRSTKSLKLIGPNSLFDHHLGSHSHVYQALKRPGKCAIVLSDEALLELIQRDSRHPLRATRSVIHCHESHTHLERFASLWDGCALEVYETHVELEWDDYTPTTGHFSPEMVGNCSSLHIEQSQGYYRWRGPFLGDPSSGIPRCPKVVIGGGKCAGISFKTIVDYLFASLHDGRKRELEISATLYTDAATETEPGRLMALIQERLATCVQQIPKFKLKLRLVATTATVQEQVLGTFELLTQAKSEEGSDNSRHHHCTFMVEERKGWNLLIDVECV